jgi:hypothetical protein
MKASTFSNERPVNIAPKQNDGFSQRLAWRCQMPVSGSLGHSNRDKLQNRRNRYRIWTEAPSQNRHGVGSCGVLGG